MRQELYIFISQDGQKVCLGWSEETETDKDIPYETFSKKNLEKQDLTSQIFFIASIFTEPDSPLRLKYLLPT